MLLFRLVRFLFSCVVLTILLWFTVTVPIGRFTLWQHVVRIARTPEAKDLAQGTKAVVQDTAARVQKELDAPPPALQEPPAPLPPQPRDPARPRPPRTAAEPRPEMKRPAP